MRPLLLILLAGLSLAACQETPADPEAARPELHPGFGEKFTLHYQQRALLPAGPAPELTVQLADVPYSYCPPLECSGNPSLRCFFGSSVGPVFSVTDAQGQVQEVRFPLTYAPAEHDTVSVRANNQRYQLRYVRWEMLCCNPQRKDISVTLQLDKAVQ
ncbi:hypothetical protein [Hymenobacter sp. B81]|uniref:hypothetical protein n=1 Tax=Hymenobacter sp. B81 TaxID=3344878 RepID=UPI0037DCB24F